MAKVKWAVASRKRRKRLLAKAKGYWGARGRNVRKAKETVIRAEAFATRDRHARKRDFRALWVIRLNAAARSRGLKYSELIAAFRRAKIGLNRKQLTELAIHDVKGFDELVASAVGSKTRTAAKSA